MERITLNTIDKKLAVICVQTKHIEETIQEIKKGNEQRDVHVFQIGEKMATHEACINDNKEEINGLRSKLGNSELINAFLAGLAGIIGVFVNPKK